jgi:hypothetical protein
MELVSRMQSDAERISCKLIAAKITKVLKDDRSQRRPKGVTAASQERRRLLSEARAVSRLMSGTMTSSRTVTSES